MVPRPPSFAACYLIAGLIVLLSAPVALTAQRQADGAHHRLRWVTPLPETLRPFPGAPLSPVRLAPPRADGWRSDGTRAPEAPVQDARLPVLDYDGRVIPRSEIEGRVDQSGRAGMFLGALGGLAIGGLVGFVAASMVACSREEGWSGLYDNCSPQEGALRGAWVMGSVTAGVITFGHLGWQDDRTTWWEAVEGIRQERRGGAAPGGSR